MSERDQVYCRDKESSTSMRVLDRVVHVLKPAKYQVFNKYYHLMRFTDNLTDDGESYEAAKKVIEDQKLVLVSLQRQKDFLPQTPYQDQLIEVVKSIPENLRAYFIENCSSILGHFELDLGHRVSLAPYSKRDLEKHIEGGFVAVFATIKTVLADRPFETWRCPKLLRVHGRVESLTDIAEDLERGFVLHPKEDGADWVDDLSEGKEVPAFKIDSYVVRQRKELASEMFKFAPAAFEEFGGVIGFLMTADYYKRSFSTRRRRFGPKETVVFAKRRIKQD